MMTFNFGGNEYFEIEKVAGSIHVRHFTPKQPTAAHPNPTGHSCQTTYFGRDSLVYAINSMVYTKVADIECRGAIREFLKPFNDGIDRIRAVISEGLNVEHVPLKHVKMPAERDCKTSSPEPQKPTYTMTDKANGAPFDMFIKTGWTAEQLVEHGYAIKA